MVDDAVYVYGVLLQADPDLSSLHGVEDAEVSTVGHAGVVALTSRLRRGSLTARDVRAHWQVLDRAFQQTTVLPLRFGTVMESEDALREQFLEPNAEQLLGLLKEMRGLMQLNLKGRYNEDVLLRQIVQEHRGIATLRERVAGVPAEAAMAEQINLGQLVEGEIARHREQDTEIALQMLAPAAVATHAEEVAHPAAFDLAFLVERASEKGFGQAVHGLREQVGSRIEIRYVGPLPPFSFARADLIAGGAAWA